MPSTATVHQARAFEETTKRLLAQLVNERLVDAHFEQPSKRRICLRRRQNLGPSTQQVKVNHVRRFCHDTDAVQQLLRPTDLGCPVVLETEISQVAEVDPGIIFEFISPWLECEDRTKREIAEELRNSALMLEQWIKLSTTQETPSLQSSFLHWERTLTFGHPSHPFSRTCFADALIKPIDPEDLADVLSPGLSFFKIPSTAVRTFGRFEDIIRSVQDKLEMRDAAPGMVVIPCLSRQAPAIQALFPSATLMKEIPTCAEAQAAIRTVSIHGVPEFDFKFSLARKITSALRAIPCWAAQIVPDITRIVKRLVPDELWVFGEVAAVTGSQQDLSKARHLTCIVRENLEHKAKAHGEVLILAAALMEKPIDDCRTYAESVFDLKTTEQKLNWLARYVEILLRLTLHPLLHHGIGFESHAQNTVARVCIETKEIKGFAIRDLAGLKIQRPSLRDHDFNLSTFNSICTDDLHLVWDRVHHALVQNHIGFMLDALDLEGPGEGWKTVQEALWEVLQPENSILARSIFHYFTREKMQFKCFLTMRMEASFRTSLKIYEMEIPNVFSGR